MPLAHWLIVHAADELGMELRKKPIKNHIRVSKKLSSPENSLLSFFIFYFCFFLFFFTSFVASCA
jgi:hypothetical protein